MKHVKILGLLFMFVTIVFSCGGGGDEAPEPPKKPEPSSSTDCSTAKINLIFPLDGEECQEGNVTGDKIKTPFRWNTQGSVTISSIKITNLTDNTEVTTDGISLVSGMEIPLEFGKEFEWMVIGKCANTNNVNSTMYVFTTQGPPNTNSAPYPAEISIINNANRRATIVWVAVDEDNDQLSFEVYMDKKTDPTTLISSNISSPSGEENSINRDFDSGGTYYVKIITTDLSENKSIAIESFVVL